MKAPAKKFQDIEFVLIAELPPGQVAPFSDFVKDRPRPQFYEHIFPNKDCAFYADYLEWYRQAHKS